MGIRSNTALAGKVCLLVILLLAGLTVLGCAGIRSVPEGGSGGTITDGTLFLCPALKQAGGLGCAAPSGEGKLVAVNTSDGSRRWEITLETSTPAGGFGCAPAAVPVAVYGKPAMTGDLVYVAGYNGKIYAINSASGALRWVYPREGNLKPIVSGVVAAQDKVYFGCSDGKVYALDAATGDRQWEFATGGKIWSTPAIGDQTLYIGSFDKKLYALSASDGSKQWEFEAEGAIVSTPLVYENVVYIGSFDRHLYAVDASNGSLEWKFMADSWFWAKPVAWNNVIYAACLDHKVYALDAETGEKVADFDLGSPISSSPVLVGTLISASPVPVSDLIIASEEGKVFALDTSTNQIRLLADVEEAVYAPLCASDGVVYIYGEKQNLHALNAESGAKLWSLTIK
ncbi:MAG: PQQ-binding-like beta-propeller repeat protein [Dehalococcoidia bacterium]|nr:PQQ-binding-like beta-propeller repeat protein [Dehalococcoidia bacterium]